MYISEVVSVKNVKNYPEKFKYDLKMPFSREHFRFVTFFIQNTNLFGRLCCT